MVIVSALLAFGCTTSRETAAGGASETSELKTPDGRPLRPVTLPDLSKMVASAQTQIREAHTRLMKTAQQRGAALFEISNAYGEMGKLLMAAQYAEPAEACFLNAQSLDPTEFRWPYYLAHLYRTQGDVPKTRALFERALQLKADDVDALIWLGDTFLSLGQPGAAEPQFTKALAVNDRSTAARFGLGRTALARNDYRLAVTQLEAALTLDPSAAGAHYPLSLAYSALGESKKADDHLRQRRERPVLPPDPLMAELDSLLESPQRYETQGIRALGRQEWAAAAAEFRHGLAIEPNSPSLRHRLATAMNMMGDTDGAEALFEAVAKDASDYFPTQFSLGVILQAKGRHGEAVERFTAALEQRADYAEARLRLASSLRRLGRAKESLSNYEQVARANPDLVEAQVGYAMALAQLRRYVEARDRFTDAMRTHPEEAAFSHGLARLLATVPDDRIRNGAQALRLVQELVTKGRTPDLGETMAMALAELGEYERAGSLQRDLLQGAQKAGVGSVAPRLARNLKLYESRQPCRTPWTEDEMP